jgi:hypothetical protein
MLERNWCRSRWSILSFSIYLNKVYLLVFYSILSLSLLCELGFFVSLLFGLVFFRRLLN